MNLEEMVKRLGITSTEVKSMQDYLEKAENAEVKYCEDHDREYYDFEFQGQCPICFEERLWWKYEHHGDEQARQILEKGGRLEKEKEEDST
jgi:hypothetical protein